MYRVICEKCAIRVAVQGRGLPLLKDSRLLQDVYSILRLFVSFGPVILCLAEQQIPEQGQSEQAEQIEIGDVVAFQVVEITTWQDKSM